MSGKPPASLRVRILPNLSLAAVWMMIGVLAPTVHAQDTGIENLRKTGKAFASVARTVSPSLVFIQVEKEVAVQSPRAPLPFPFGREGTPFGEDFFERFFGTPGQEPDEQKPQQKRQVIGQGSGFVISEQGHILTNNHVIADANRVTVKSDDGQEFSAEVVGTDPQSDVAVIKIEGNKVPVLPLGDSSQLEVGEWVVALGNPFGLQHTLTVGVVSAKGRTSLGISDYEDFIQTDAAINPGNSGGPLVNLSGEVVGMNTAIFSRSGGYMGIGFAIPINLAKAISDQLIEHGSVTRGYLGVVIQPLTQDLAATFGLENTKGILVSQVAENSPADKAGLKQGDVIVECAGKPVTKIGDFRNRISLKTPGSEETLTILRDGERKTVTVTIGKLSEAPQAASASGKEDAQELGFTVQTLTEQLAQQLGIQADKGVVVTQVTPGSIAARAGIEVGTVILEVNRQPVADAEEFRQAIAQTEKNDRVLLLIQKDQYRRYVVLQRS